MDKAGKKKDLLILMLLTSGVPQNVVVVASASRPSLHRPKSVSTT